MSVSKVKTSIREAKLIGFKAVFNLSVVKTELAYIGPYSVY